MGVSTWVWAFEEARRGCWVFWSWSHWGYEPPNGGAGKPKCGPLQEQSVFLSATPSLQLLLCSLETCLVEALLPYYPEVASHCSLLLFQWVLGLFPRPVRVGRAESLTFSLPRSREHLGLLTFFLSFLCILLEVYMMTGHDFCLLSHGRWLFRARSHMWTKLGDR